MLPKYPGVHIARKDSRGPIEGDAQLLGTRMPDP